MDSGHLLAEGHGQNPNRFTGITPPDWSPGRRPVFESAGDAAAEPQPAPGYPGAGLFAGTRSRARARRDQPSSFLRPVSSTVSTPKDSALSYFEPGLSPTT